MSIPKDIFGPTKDIFGPIKDISGLRNVQLFADLAAGGLPLTSVVASEVVPVTKTTLILVKIGMILFYLLWAVFFYTTYRWSQSTSVVGKGVYIWFGYVNGIVALIGFSSVILMYCVWTFLRLDDYAEEGVLAKTLHYLQEQRNKEFNILSVVFSIIRNLGWPEPDTMLRNAAEGLKLRQEILQLVRYNMYAICIFSCISLAFFIAAVPYAVEQFAGLIIILVVALIAAVMFGVFQLSSQKNVNVGAD